MTDLKISPGDIITLKKTVRTKLSNGLNVVLNPGLELTVAAIDPPNENNEPQCIYIDYSHHAITFDEIIHLALFPYEYTLNEK